MKALIFQGLAAMRGLKLAPDRDGTWCALDGKWLSRFGRIFLDLVGVCGDGKIYLEELMTYLQEGDEASEPLEERQSVFVDDES